MAGSSAGIASAAIGSSAHAAADRRFVEAEQISFGVGDGECLGGLIGDGRSDRRHGEIGFPQRAALRGFDGRDHDAGAVLRHGERE